MSEGDEEMRGPILRERGNGGTAPICGEKGGRRKGEGERKGKGKKVIAHTELAAAKTVI